MRRLLSSVDMSPTSTLLTVHWLNVDSEHLIDQLD
jgi:multisubunit Na+/H+ antiporter MnhE subunit